MSGDAQCGSVAVWLRVGVRGEITKWPFGSTVDQEAMQRRLQYGYACKGDMFSKLSVSPPLTDGVGTIALSVLFLLGCTP